MPQTSEAYDFRGRNLIDANGDKIGKIDELYYDQEGGQPEWALVNTGLFGSRKTFVPISAATPAGEDLRVPVTKDVVKDAPRVDVDEELSEQEERKLFDHYGVPYTTEGTTTASGAPGEGRATGEAGMAAGGGGAGGPGRDTSGPNTDEAMTRSEEELRVGTTARERGRVRLRKHVVTEQVTTTVPVQREEVRLEREPITDANVGAAMDGPAISEEEHEVILHEEEPVIEKRVVPKERVRLGKDTVTDEREVNEEVRKERIDADGLQERP
jgi:uncharacterized protein (TIGR02271 family)